MTYYITTAIDYPNSRPHIGHAYEKIIADALARWHRLKGEDVFFLTGTDENSQKIVDQAEKDGVPVKEFLENNVKLFKELADKLGASINAFIRTTDDKHKAVAQQLFQKVYDHGDIYKGTYKGQYCVGCERFYTDKDLEDGKCIVHKTPVKMLEEESYFFKMEKYRQGLVDHITKNPQFILPTHKRNEILNRLKEPLQDLSVSRTSITWGIPVPIDTKHVIYVWFDALINYLSGIDYPHEPFKKYWPAVHIIGKDITWFHSVIWPIMLMAADIPLPKTVHSHGFVNLKGEKLSKSRGIVVDPLDLVDKYGSDALRYYLLRAIPAGQDGDFSEDALIERANADLADALGNLVNRACVMVQKYCGGTIPQPGNLEAVDQSLVDQLPTVLFDADNAMQAYEWHRAIERIWQFIHEVNKYVNQTEPWKITDDVRRNTVLYVLVECVRNCAILVSPFVPTTAARITSTLGQHITGFSSIGFSDTTSGTIEKRAIVFHKIEKVKEDPFSALNLKVAVVDEVQDHPDADKLYVLKIRIGNEPRTVVAGLRAHLSKEEIVGKHIVIVSNLRPTKLRGIESQGMLLAAEKGDSVVLVQAPHSTPGDQVFVDDIKPRTEQITYDEFAKLTLIVKDRKVTYHDQPLKTEREELRADIGDGATVR